ncbi:ABC transporter ATP-binding protein [Actinoplanes sp. HUAS TT8]|uniref:ABC transporter ATP-binding protein n=1 Tax=Actinoplanes sp. HUAS TT8 TaxID=3447453 RepID=UPI003F51EB15
MELSSVDLGYTNGDPVLRGVTVTARPGEVLAVTGTSGAGKTTLLNAMAGLLAPRAGTVTVDGSVLGGRDDAVGRGVVLIPQENGLAAILTAAENVSVAVIATGGSPADARRRTADALAAVGLAGQANQLIEELSGGQQQRAAIARGLALRGRVVLADEVTSELDAANRQKVLELLRAEADRGATVVLATHDPEAAAACDREVHLADGVAGWARP